MVLRRWLDRIKPTLLRLRPAGAGFWWLASALVLASVAQAALLAGQVIPGLVFYLIAGVLFARLAHKAGWHLADRPIQARGTIARRALLPGGVAIALVGLACYWVWQPVTSLSEHRATLIFWLGGLAIFTAGVLRGCGWHLPGLRESLVSLGENRGEWIKFTALAALALFLRTVDLEQHPYAFANDEGWLGVEGWRILTGEVTNMFRTGWSAQPNLSFVPDALSITLFGQTIGAVRLVSAAAGTLTVIFTALAGREAFGRRVGWSAALLLACMPVHIHFSRTGFSNILPGFHAALLVWLTLRALHRGEISAYLWAGLATGSALYTYLGCRLAMLLAAGILVFAALRQRGYLRTHLVHLLVFCVAAVLVAAPIATFFIKEIDLFMARVNAEGIFQSGWLSRELASGRTAIEILVDQLARSSLVFISTGGRAAFYNSPYPYLPAAAALIGTLGMAYSLSRLRSMGHGVLQAWFWSVILTAGMLTINPPQHQRMVMALPAVALLVAIGLEQLMLVGARLRLGAHRLWHCLAVLVVAVTGLHGVGFYFGEYQAKGYYGDRGNEVAVESIRLARYLGPSYRFVSLAAPEVFLEFANFRYLLNGFIRSEYNNESGAQIAREVGPATPAFFFAILERRADLEQVAQALPGGQWLEIRRRMLPDHPLFFGYITPPPNPPLQLPLPENPPSFPAAWLWILLLLILVILTAWQLLPFFLRAARKRSAGSTSTVQLAVSLRGKLRTWWASPLPELASLPPPELDFGWKRLLRWMPGTAPGGMPTLEDTGREYGDLPCSMQAAQPAQPVRSAQVEVEVELAPGETLRIDIHPDHAEIHCPGKSKS